MTNEGEREVLAQALMNLTESVMDVLSDLQTGDYDDDVHPVVSQAMRELKEYAETAERVALPYRNKEDT